MPLTYISRWPLRSPLGFALGHGSCHAGPGLCDFYWCLCDAFTFPWICSWFSCFSFRLLTSSSRWCFLLMASCGSWVVTPDAVVGLLPSCSTLPMVSPSIVSCHFGSLCFLLGMFLSLWLLICLAFRCHHIRLRPAFGSCAAAPFSPLVLRPSCCRFGALLSPPLTLLFRMVLNCFSLLCNSWVFDLG